MNVTPSMSVVVKSLHSACIAGLRPVEDGEARARVRQPSRGLSTVGLTLLGAPVTRGRQAPRQARRGPAVDNPGLPLARAWRAQSRGSEVHTLRCLLSSPNGKFACGSNLEAKSADTACLLGRTSFGSVLRRLLFVSMVIIEHLILDTRVQDRRGQTLLLRAATLARSRGCASSCLSTSASPVL